MLSCEKLWKCERFSAKRLIKNFLYQDILENVNIGRFSVKVANNRFGRTNCRKCVDLCCGNTVRVKW